jgi:hypothetical protein
MLYVLPRNPASPTLSLPRLRAHARRAGYKIVRDLLSGTFSLVDAQLGLPLVGLDHVELPQIASAIEMVRGTTADAHQGRRRHGDRYRGRAAA